MQFNQSLSQFHHKVRVRVCGLCFRDNQLLLLKHKGIGKSTHLWSPPGGGLAFGEDLKTCLRREFMEEVKLDIQVNEFLFGNEYIDQKLHAIELFFHVSAVKNIPTLGSDPELPSDKQIITDCRFFDDQALNQVRPENKHNVFHHIHQISELLNLKGFYFFNNI